jgi:hypothetical protein
MGSIKRIIFLALLFLVAWSSTATLEPLCDIHVTNPGRRTPNTTLPFKATSKWLYSNAMKIEEFYKEAQRGCHEVVRGAVQELEAGGHADYFTDPNNLPPKTGCRGRNTLFNFTGTALVPFGPYQECITYSKCWFGLMTCGTAKNEQIASTITPMLSKEMQVSNIPGKIPEFTRFSVRALNMLIRVVGAEIVVPDLRYMTLSNGEDVLIGQYVLTRPYDSTRLEIRMFELYPSVLMKWSASHIRDYGVHNIASMHLGGSEGRCLPHPAPCYFANNCCGCDKKSFVRNTPVDVNVTDGEARCPGVRNKPLPLCPVRDSTQPGRWIASALPQFTPHCRADSPRSVLFHGDVKHLPTDSNAADSIVNGEGVFNMSAHQYHGSQWHEASGDPCLINSKDAEEAGQTHWFYAPYTCKYHFYSTMELHQCLLDQNLSHIHVAGDSLSRDLFSFISLYLGVPHVDGAALKHLTNNLKENNVKFHSGKVLLSEGYSWRYTLPIMQLTEQAPLPNVYLNNYALAHRWNLSYPRFQQEWNATEYQYWTVQRPKSVPLPKFMFFENAKELSGRRNIGWSGNVFRQDSAYLERNYTQFGFRMLDEFLFSSGRYDYHIPTSDGWHFYGTKRQMEVVALFNMVCNDWLRDLGKKK